MLGWRSTLGQWTIIADGRPCHTRSEGAGHWCPTAVNAIVEFQRINALWAIGRNTRPKTKRDYRSKHVRFFAFRSRPHEYGAGRDERCDQIQGTPLETFTRSVIDAFLGGRFRHDRLS